MEKILATKRNINQRMEIVTNRHIFLIILQVILLGRNLYVKTRKKLTWGKLAFFHNFVFIVTKRKLGHQTLGTFFFIHTFESIEKRQSHALSRVQKKKITSTIFTAFGPHLVTKNGNRVRCLRFSKKNVSTLNNPRANGAKRRSGRKTGARVTNFVLAELEVVARDH